MLMSSAEPVNFSPMPCITLRYSTIRIPFYSNHLISLLKKLISLLKESMWGAKEPLSECVEIRWSPEWMYTADKGTAMSKINYSDSWETVTPSP